MAGDECPVPSRFARADARNESDARSWRTKTTPDRSHARSRGLQRRGRRGVAQRRANGVCAFRARRFFGKRTRENDRTRSRDDDDDARFVFVVCVSVLIIITCVRVGRGGKKNKVSDARARVRLVSRAARAASRRVASRPTQKPFDFWKD